MPLRAEFDEEATGSEAGSELYFVSIAMARDLHFFSGDHPVSNWSSRAKAAPYRDPSPPTAQLSFVGTPSG